jgi:hypothetical protein
MGHFTSRSSKGLFPSWSFCPQISTLTPPKPSMETRSLKKVTLPVCRFIPCLVHLTVRLSSFYYVSLAFDLSINQPIYLSVYLCLSICVCMYVCMYDACMHASIYISIHLLIDISVYLSIHPSIYLYNYFKALHFQ